MKSVTVVAYCTPQPQGSTKGFVGKSPTGKLRAIITSDNSKVRPYRSEVAGCARRALLAADIAEPMAPKHVPVSIEVTWFLKRPDSIPKRRVHHVVKPDADKLLRATVDACTGILWHDDAQIVEVRYRKRYGSPERVEMKAVVLEGDGFWSEISEFERNTDGEGEVKNLRLF